MARVYLYTFHERIWHWLQALAMILLMATGLEIRHPGAVPLLGFDAAVTLHNALGFALILNALLGLAYHVFTEEILQFVPQPRGFFDMAWRQAASYLRGIFRGDPHPIENNPDNKLNPLQRVTYLLILNVLLPLQLATGLAMWGAQRWPAVSARLGGLSLLAPLHALIAWAFVAFLVMHVYLATTGHTPTANIKAMIVGWEDLPAGHGPASAAAPRRYGLQRVGRVETPRDFASQGGE